jgi:hypothetical protein
MKENLELYNFCSMDFFVRILHEAWWTINCAIPEPKIFLTTWKLWVWFSRGIPVNWLEWVNKTMKCSKLCFLCWINEAASSGRLNDRENHGKKCRSAVGIDCMSWGSGDECLSHCTTEAAWQAARNDLKLDTAPLSCKTAELYSNPAAVITEPQSKLPNLRDANR